MDDGDAKTALSVCAEGNGPVKFGPIRNGLVNVLPNGLLSFRLNFRVRLEQLDPILRKRRESRPVPARPRADRSRRRRLKRELEDLQLVMRARNGDHEGARRRSIRRYTGFVRLKASSYFLAGGDAEDLIQEGLIGLYKAVRDFRPDKETSFRSFAELCVTRQIITAIKTATRFKHAPLNTYVSFSHTPGGPGVRRRLHPRRRAARPVASTTRRSA